MRELKKLFFPPIVIIILCTLLLSCGSSQVAAPVVNGWQQSAGEQGVHRVQKGETLYSIAWAYGYDYRDIAEVNHIPAPYVITAGQSLYIENDIKNNKVNSKATKKVQIGGTKSPVVVSNNKPALNKPKDTSRSQGTKWSWPVQGEVKEKFSLSGNINKGINIASKYGSPVRSAGAGEVVYSGSGLMGYGNLIIIKHNDDYLSAYAFNRVNLVKEGTWVKAQQKIAEVGQGDNGVPLLHFEIRKNGKPVNPMQYLS